MNNQEEIILMYGESTFHLKPQGLIDLHIFRNDFLNINTIEATYNSGKKRTLFLPSKSKVYSTKE